MSKKVVYYKDILRDDFSKNNIKTKPLPENFKYVNRRPLWNVIAWFLYFIIAPIVGLILCWGKLRIRFKNKKVLKKCRKQGYFIYANHTQGAADAFLPALAIYPKRNYILANKDAVSIRGIKQLVLMLGAIPVAESLGNMKTMTRCIEKRIKDKHVITIYPEASIWPYNTMIRPFTNASFRYPINLDAPVYAQTLVYRERKGITKYFTKRPFATVHIDGPFYPDKTLPTKEAMQKLRDEVYDAMCKRAHVPENFAYVQYLPESEKPVEEDKTAN